MSDPDLIRAILLSLGSSLTTKRYKAVFVINGALHMSTGKIAAQVGHGAIALSNLITDEDALDTWQGSGEKIVVVKGMTIIT